MNKKAQIQTGETIAVVIIVMVMIFIGIWISFTQSIGTQTTEDTSAAELQRLSTAIVSSALDELKCSSFNDYSTSCLDMYRVRALANLTRIEKYGRSYKYYYDLFRKSRITIHVIYPEEPNPADADLLIYEYNGTTNTSVPIFMPVLLYDSVLQTNRFGIIEVRTFKD